MTIQWTLVAGFLYLELAFIFLLILPFITPKVWQYVFYSRLCRALASKANVYFTVFIIVLIFFFLDSIREMLNYSSKTSNIDLGHDIQIHMKLFRSQRNYYISGFAVFLWLVIRRLVMLVLCEAELLEENESAMKRAQNATETVEKILKRKEEVEREKSVITQLSVMEANELRKAIEEKQSELNSTMKVVEEVKQKSLSITKEYEELLEKHTDLLNELKNKEEREKETQDNKSDEEEKSDISDDLEEKSDTEEESESREVKANSKSAEDEELSDE